MPNNHDQPTVERDLNWVRSKIRSKEIRLIAESDRHLLISYPHGEWMTISKEEPAISSAIQSEILFRQVRSMYWKIEKSHELFQSLNWIRPAGLVVMAIGLVLIISSVLNLGSYEPGTSESGLSLPFVVGSLILAPVACFVGIKIGAVVISRKTWPTSMPFYVTSERYQSDYLRALEIYRKSIIRQEQEQNLHS